MLLFIKILLISCFLLLIVNFTAAYNVLVVFPEPTKSHGILGDAYVEYLTKTGHYVVYITPYPHENTTTLTYVSVESNLKKSKEIYKDLKIKYGSDHKFLLMLGHKFARMTVEHPNVQNLLSAANIKFDVVIAEWIDSEIYSGFAAVFDCPLIWAVSTHLHWQPLRLMDDYPNPSYSADLNSGEVTPFNFSTRMTELWVQVMKTWILHFVNGSGFLKNVFKNWILMTDFPLNKNNYLHFHLFFLFIIIIMGVFRLVFFYLPLPSFTIKPMEVEVYDRFMKTASRRSIEPYDEVSNRYSLMLVNSYPTIGPALRVPPSVKYVGGYHMNMMRKNKMNHDIKKCMNEKVIYFSFGTTVHTKDMSRNMKSALLMMFGDLSYNVIWKVDDDDEFDDVPINVCITHWVPQIAILDHPNMKLFINHGGLLSIMEAISHKVPMVVVPRNGDQFTNANLLVKHGVAVKVQYSETLAEDLDKAIETVLRDDKYKDKARELLKVFRRPLDPEDDIKFWVKYIIENGGSHLRSVALDVPLYQKLYVDLASIIFGIVLFISILIGLCCCCKITINWCMIGFRW